MLLQFIEFVRQPSIFIQNQLALVIQLLDHHFCFLNPSALRLRVLFRISQQPAQMSNLAFLSIQSALEL